MITQEEIPFTQEEYKAMVKTIAQLRKEKKELLDRACEWLKENLPIYEQPNTFINEFREAMKGG